jgi:phosphoadenosine phosphosulfate reductase
MQSIKPDDKTLGSSSCERKSANEILEWAVDAFGNKIALASSFGAEDVVIIDMLCKITNKPRVFTLDTGRLHQETYDLMDQIRSRYGISVEVYFPDAGRIEEMVRNYGINLFYNSADLRKMCCGIRKVEPLYRAMSGLSAWITGLRRDQNFTRRDIKKVEVDAEHTGITKVNPIADWSWENVWEYIRENSVPYNKLHDLGFPSIGCEPCTRAVKRGEDPRAGRWWWELGPKECGLHLRHS